MKLRRTISGIGLGGAPVVFAEPVSQVLKLSVETAPGVVTYDKHRLSVHIPVFDRRLLAHAARDAGGAMTRCGEPGTADLRGLG